ncbi:hypothetical protein [Metallibacterium scheffleri]|uniref:NolW-like domain-containing protein n=1 Tax=Metallibacterium scheffleri TaxID=993689 RepID=A0A4S3KT62_9GAMM|nr:hypothetical protein [Metallibacterium scheffleri]THD12186.1 hypothetical protein B1806_01150 [Metallibacterium scheffleri]
MPKKKLAYLRMAHECARLPLLFMLLGALGACAVPAVPERPAPPAAALNAMDPRAATTRVPAPVAPALRAAAAALLGGAAPADYARGSVRADASGRLQVYVHADAVTPALVAALEQAGLRQTSAVPALDVVQGWVAPRDLDALAHVAGVSAITPPRYAVTR